MFLSSCLASRCIKAGQTQDEMVTDLFIPATWVDGLRKLLDTIVCLYKNNK